MPLKLLITADLHLGRKSSSVPRTVDESSTKYTWHRMVDWAIKNQVDAVVLAGDIIDRDNRYFEAIGPIQEGFEKLNEAKISVLIVAGNHDFDVLPNVVKSKEYDHVHLLGENGRWESKTIKSINGELQFLGWSFPSQYVKEDPLLQLPSADVKLDPNIPTIGLLHGELNDLNSRYAPIGFNNLLNKNVDAWVLGHIHKPEIHHESNPLVLYPGSPHALSSKEPGSHGPYLLTVEDSKKVKTEIIPLSPLRYEKLEMNVSNVADKSEYRNLITQHLSDDVESKTTELQHVSQIIYDIVLVGKHSLKSEFDTWSQNIEDLEQEFASETTASIRKVVNRIEPKVENLEELAKQPDPTGILAKAILDIHAGNSSEFLTKLSEEFGRKLSNVNAARTYQPLRKADEQYSDSSENANEFLLQECEQLLAELLSQKGDIQ
ncbi:MAG: DNA repair exonuclease [Balneolaceae bacterium]|nr:DNA repair exonuclease [Balneolaceae bacterium]